MTTIVPIATGPRSDELVNALADALGEGPAVVPFAGFDATATLAMARPDIPAEVADLAAIVATSGSTGTPKGVLLTRTAIAAGVEATHDHLGGPGSWTLALPGHYVAGLMVIARTIVAGTTLQHASPDLSDLPAPSSPGPHYISLVPTQLVRALTQPETTRRLRRYDAILLGGAAADTALLAQATDAGLRVVTTYGMSETCGGCVYQQRPLPGVQVAADPATGRLRIAGPMLFSGYRLQPELTAEVLTAGWFLTNDHGRIEGDGRVRVQGRIDDIVISGGVNVDLAAIERTARRVAATRHGHQVEIAVIGVPDQEWGTRVIAVSEAPLTRDELAAELAGAALPRQIEVVTPLPRTSSGKIDRQALRDRWS